MSRSSLCGAVRSRNALYRLYAGRGESEDPRNSQGRALVNSAQQGDRVQIVLDQTPFYAASGGQIGDLGWMESSPRPLSEPARSSLVRGELGAFEVEDTQKESGYFFHVGIVTSGSIVTGGVSMSASMSPAVMPFGATIRPPI